MVSILILITLLSNFFLTHTMENKSSEELYLTIEKLPKKTSFKSLLKNEEDIEITLIEEEIEEKDEKEGQEKNSDLDSKTIRMFHDLIEKNPKQAAEMLKKHPKLAFARTVFENLHPIATFLDVFKNNEKAFNQDSISLRPLMGLFDLLIAENTKNSKKYPLKAKNTKGLMRMVAQNSITENQKKLLFKKIKANDLIKPTGILEMTEEEFFKEFSPLNEDMLFFLKDHPEWIRKNDTSGKSTLNYILTNFSGSFVTANVSDFNNIKISNLEITETNNSNLDQKIAELIISTDPSQLLSNMYDENSIFKIIDSHSHYSDNQKTLRTIIWSTLEQLSKNNIDKDTLNKLSTNINNANYQDALKHIKKEPHYLYTCGGKNMPYWAKILNKTTPNDEKQASAFSDLNYIINQLVDPKCLREILRKKEKTVDCKNFEDKIVNQISYYEKIEQFKKQSLQRKLSLSLTDGKERKELEKKLSIDNETEFKKVVISPRLNNTNSISLDNTKNN